MAVTLTVLRDGKLLISAPHNARFLVDLNYQVPYWAMSWVQATRVWMIHSEFRATAARLVDLHFDNVVVKNACDGPGGPSDEPPVFSEPRADWATGMFAAVPPSLHQRLYRAVSKVLHPDVGGDPVAMMQLTVAYSANDGDVLT